MSTVISTKESLSWPSSRTGIFVWLFDRLIPKEFNKIDRYIRDGICVLR